MPRADQLLDSVAAGSRQALARAVTHIELRDPAMTEALATRTVRRRTGPGQPHVLGLTGPPGAGKSTLADALLAHARAQGERIAVIAVDPSSPFTGGAILGDRIRMERHTEDDLVFVRSLSSRGHVGGLTPSTSAVVDLLDFAGFDRILVETVGVGQSELGVLEVADTVCVVLTPESGDAVQAMKAGLLEAADLYVVNKADRPGAPQLVRELERAVALSEEGGWIPPVNLVVATEGRGVDELARAAAAHLLWCRGEGRAAWNRRRGDARVRLVLDLVAEEARDRAARRLRDDPALAADVRNGHDAAHTVAGRIG
jgi:LAO/AO transport system kinase